MNKTNIVSLIVIAIIAISTAFIVKPIIQVSPTPVTVNVPKAAVEKVVGASGSGQDTYSRQFFNGGLTQGGSFATTTLPGLTTYRLAASDLNSSVIQWNNGVNMTLQIGSSTGAIIPKAGDVAKIVFLNASTTAGSAITFAAADAMVDLQFTEATGGDLVLNGLDWAELTFIRQTSGKITVLFDEFTEAD